MNLSPYPSRWRACCLALAAALLVGCGGDDPTGEWYSNWDVDGGCNSKLAGTPRIDANGQPADFCEQAAWGWTWVFYGAAWCSSSRTQAARIPELVARSGGRVRVFTVPDFDTSRKHARREAVWQ